MVKALGVTQVRSGEREGGALATADGDETLPLLGLLPGSWGGGLDQWRPSWMGGHPGARLLERMGRTARPTLTPRLIKK